MSELVRGTRRHIWARRGAWKGRRLRNHAPYGRGKGKEAVSSPYMADRSGGRWSLMVCIRNPGRRISWLPRNTHDKCLKVLVSQSRGLGVVTCLIAALPLLDEAPQRYRISSTSSFVGTGDNFFERYELHLIRDTIYFPCIYPLSVAKRKIKCQNI